MNYFKLKFLLLFFALAVAIPPAWAGTVTLTLTDFPDLTGSYSSGSITKDGITYQYTDFIKSNENIQAKASTGCIYNKTPFPGEITSVAITHHGTARATTISGSSDGENWTPVADGSGSITGDFSNKGYKYFKITRGSNAAYWTKIEITYTEGGDTPPAEENIYQKVTNASQLVADKTYIIVNESANVGMGAVDDYRYGTVVTGLEFDDGKVNIGGTEVTELTLGGKENAWTFMLPNSQYLAKGNNDNKFLLATSPTTNISKWTIDLSNGCSIINNDNSDESYRYIRYENNNNRFDISNYSNVALYVKYEGGDTPQPADVTLSFPENSYTATLGQTFTAPTLNVDPADAASEVTYSSSNTGVATVDALTGAVTLVAAGTTTITAEISGSETYKNTSDSYTLTVNPDLTNMAILDFTSNEYWNDELPTDLTVGPNTYYDGTYYVTIAGSSGNGYRLAKVSNSSKYYLLNGKEGAYVKLPAFNRAVKKIVVEGNSGASTSTVQNIFVGDVAVSNQTTGARETNTYEIASDYQAAGNIYTLKVLSNHNTQISRIIIHFDENSSAVPLIFVDPTSVTITDTTGDDKTGTISATVDPAGTVNATATEGWSATNSSVTYQGKALHAEGTATFSSTGATDVEASLEYNYTGPLYILGTVNNGGWAPNNYVAMTRGADGLYTVRVTTNAGKEGLSWISFTKRVANDADDGAWNYIAPYRFVPYSKNGDAWWLTDGTVNQFNDLDFDPNHVDAQPVRMSPGTYDITINANDNTFKIEPYIVTVETPTFNPEAGSYKTFQSVTISCATEGATIHYTVDGSEPTESSPVYGDPISVESKTTIKAIAMKSGMANSAIAEATYNLPQTVATMAEAMGVAANSYFLFTGDAVVTYAGQSTINSNYHYIFIRDKRAENGGGVIFYSTNNNVTVPSVQATNVLKRGWYAQLRPYNSWKEFQKAEFVEASDETAADDAAPFDRTGKELKYDDNVNEYVKIDNVTYNEGNITYAGQNREDVTYTYKVVNHFNVSLEDGKHYNIEGVVTRNNNTIEFYPTAATLAKQDLTLSFDPASVELYVGETFTAPELKGLPEGATIDVTYSSNNTDVAIVTDNVVSLVKGATGTATITATFAGNDEYNKASATYTIKVKAKEVATLSFDVEGITVYPNAEDFNQPKLTTTPENLTVTYTSTDDNIATVVDGVLMIGDKTGTATITATFAGNDTYGTATATYTVTVEPRPIVVADDVVEFELYVGQTETKTFTVMAENLKGDITLTLSESDVFTITPPTIAKADMTKDGVKVTVTYTPKAATGEDFDEATVTLSTKDAEKDATVTLIGMAEVQPVVAAPTFSLVAGTYGKAQQLIISAESGATILYSTDGSEPTTKYTNAIDLGQGTTTVKAVATKDGFAKSPVVTATYIIDIPKDLPKITPFKGYYQIKNNGNGMYANIAGRKTLNFTDAPADKAGTVIWLETNDKGQVQSIRSQAADLQGYANRAMRYVPKMVDIVVNKINEMEGIEDATGAGSVLGENGLKEIMAKFNECFDYHLYVEQAGEGGWRLYGKTPNMQHVVDFYRDHKDQVEAKLPKLEDFINDALDKLKAKIGGDSVFTEFKLLDIWQKMGGTLTKPTDDASTMTFYREVLNNKNYVWDFAYQTAQIYWGNVKKHPRYKELKAQLGEYADYIDEFVTQVRPDFKYYVIQRGNEPDYISEGNGEIISNQPHTIWTLEPRTDFTVNIAGEQFGYGLGGYATTNYTDFAYTVPEGVTAYKVASVENGVAKLEALSGVIPAQTPVLLIAKEAGNYVLTLSTEAGTTVSDNLLVGPDYLIKTYELKTPMVEQLFVLAKGVLGEQLYNQYVAEYEYLQLLYAGTVNNKYFWGLSQKNVEKCVYINEENTQDCVIRNLVNGEFVNDWKSPDTNKAFLVSETDQTIKLPSLRGDINKDGVISIIDVTALIDILLDLPDRNYLKPTDSYPKGLDYEAANVNENEKIEITDVTTLIDILLNMPDQPAQGSGN